MDEMGIEELQVWTEGWTDRVYTEGSEDPDITLAELILLYFEWMSVHKATNASARAVYSLLLLVLPKDSNAGNYALSQKMLRKILETRVQLIEICPNDHVAFIDCQHPTLAHYQHAHRTCCPVCGCDRRLYLEDGSGRTRAAKTVYHLPIGPWLRDLFRDKEVAAYLDSALSNKPAGHVTKSRGWHEKVGDYCVSSFVWLVPFR
jgi:hypothetical protein